MGNSLLDVVVFGRVAGIEAAELASKTELSDKLSLDFVKEFEKQRKEAGINTDEVSPKILPKYTHGNPVFEEVKGK